MSDAPAYRAFLSYSHADAAIAERLHKRWEAFRIDRDLRGLDTPRGQVPDSLRQIFIDRGDFGPGQSLNDATLAALAGSGALILLASPNAAQSPNVDAEVRLFRELHPDLPVIPLILSGSVKDDATMCFPPSLTPDILAADWQKDGHDRAAAKVVAALLGLPPDLIYRRANRQRRRTRLGWALAASVLATSLSGAGYWWLVSHQQQQVIQETTTTLATIEDIARKIDPIGSAQAVGTGDHARLIQTLSRIADGAATNPRYAQALELLKAGKTAEAEPVLRAAAEEMERNVRQSGKQAAEAWRNLGDIAGLRDPKAALESYRKALALDPDNAVALYWAGWMEKEAGNLAEAERAYRRLLTLPTGSADGEHAFGSQIGLGDIAQARGALPEALKAYRSSQGMAERLAQADPGNAGWQYDLGISNERLGDVLVAQGNLTEALTAYRARHAIAERLAQADPGNAGWQRDLSVSHDRLGDVLVAQGNLTDALTEYRADLAIAERLAQADPGNAGWQRDLSVSHNKLGDVLVAQGNLTAALTAYRATHTILERLAQADPGNAGWQRDLSVSHEKLGDVLVAQGNLPEALAEYRATHTILERLAQADPGNAGWQRDLSVSHNNFGDVLAAQGNLPEALAEYRATHTILERLAQADPGNAGWQRDLSVSHNNFGDVLAAQGNLPEALTAYRAGLAIAERLAQADPGNAGWQRDLAVSYSNLANVAIKSKDTAEAKRHLTAGRAIMAGLTAKYPDWAEWKNDLTWFDGQLAALK